MQKQKENLFRDKFRLLNSQENTEEIIWSLSDSSEYEEPQIEKFNNITNKTRVLKRKRRKKVPKNLSNLSINVLDTSINNKDLQRGETSPILINKATDNAVVQSTILPPKCTSPVLPTRYLREKSPILTLKNYSPKCVGRVKNNLFANINRKHGQSQPKIERKPNKIDSIEVQTEIHSDCDIEDSLSCRNVSWNLGDVKEEDTSKAKLELVTKVKSFFDSHFSSETSTSQSINNTPTQRDKDSSKTSDDLEILTCKTEIGSRNNSITVTIKKDILNEEQVKQKKIRYKKDGLAYRLNTLLRKQNSCLSLWQHERFLAANSNFIIPKGENTVFRIRKVYFQYGCYLLEAVDLNEDDYLVLINECYVSFSIVSDTIIKVYEPFQILQYNKDTKLLVNVCRFECSEYRV